MSSLSKIEEGLAAELRTRVSDIRTQLQGENDDLFLVRWLRAKDLNLSAAEGMLRKSLKWRKDYDVDRVLEDGFPEAFKEQFPFYLDSRDRDGRVVLFGRPGVWDLRKLVENAGGSEEFYRYVCYCYERTMEEITKCNLNKALFNWDLTTVVFILDYGGMSLRTVMHWKAVQCLLSSASVYQDNYPEIAHRIILINCSYVFTAFYKLAKPLLSEKTISKIQIFGSNENEWRKAIFEQCAPNQVPIFFGGTKSVNRLG